MQEEKNEERLKEFSISYKSTDNDRKNLPLRVQIKELSFIFGRTTVSGDARL